MHRYGKDLGESASSGSSSRCVSSSDRHIHDLRLTNKSIISRSDRVVFITDFTRLQKKGDTLSASGEGPLRWLSQILTSSEAWRDSHLTFGIISPFSGDAVNSSAFSSRKAFIEYIEDPSSAWARRFHSDGESLFPRWWRKVIAADLVVGFELSPALRKALHRSGKRYVSFHIHPLRFLRDLCLGAVSNDPLLVTTLETSAVPDSEVTLQLHRFRALCGFQRPSALKVPEGLPILIGQTPRDSVLIRDDGTFADWLDYEEELQAQLSGFDACVLIEHPYRADSRDIAEYLRCRHGKSVISTKTNGYGLLFSMVKTPAVLTLASSLGVEAEATGFPVSFLLGDPRHLMLLPEQESGSLVPLGHRSLSDEVWRSILGRGSEARKTKPHTGSAWALGDHYLRDSLEGWGYQALRNRLAGLRADTRWLPSALMSEERAGELLQQLHPLPQWAGEIELKVSERPLKLNETRSLSGTDPGFADLLGAGFHGAEDWGAWALPGASELVIPVDPTNGAVLEVDVDVRCFEGTLHQCPVLEVSHEDEMLGVVMFRPIALRSAQMKLTCRADNAPVRLKFQMSDGVSPYEGGNSSDTRPLGFGITKVDLRLTKRPTRNGHGVAIWGLPADDGRPSTMPMQLLLTG